MFEPKKFGNIGSHVKSGSTFQVFSYLGDIDDKATIIASGYFNTIKESLRRNDIIKVLDKTITPVNTYEVMVSALPLSGDVEVIELAYYSIEASNVTYDNTGNTGILNAATNVQDALDAVDTAVNQSVRTTATPTFADIIDTGLTTDELISANASKELVSLSVATYPSLTELSYVKGVTSAIQTQINSKLAAARGNWKVFYSDGAGVFTELALGASGTVLQSNGASSAPSFATPTAGGGVGLETVLMLGGM